MPPKANKNKGQIIKLSSHAQINVYFVPLPAAADVFHRPTTNNPYPLEDLHTIYRRSYKEMTALYKKSLTELSLAGSLFELKIKEAIRCQMQCMIQMKEVLLTSTARRY